MSKESNWTWKIEQRNSMKRKRRKRRKREDETNNIHLVASSHRRRIVCTEKSLFYSVSFIEGSFFYTFKVRIYCFYLINIHEVNKSEIKRMENKTKKYPKELMRSQKQAMKKNERIHT